jgi:hypothetical protein
MIERAFICTNPDCMISATPVHKVSFTPGRTFKKTEQNFKSTEKLMSTCLNECILDNHASVPSLFWLTQNSRQEIKSPPLKPAPFPI